MDSEELSTLLERTPRSKYQGFLRVLKTCSSLIGSVFLVVQTLIWEALAVFVFLRFLVLSLVDIIMALVYLDDCPGNGAVYYWLFYAGVVNLSLLCDITEKILENAAMLFLFGIYVSWSLFDFQKKWEPALHSSQYYCHPTLFYYTTFSVASVLWLDVLLCFWIALCPSDD